MKVILDSSVFVRDLQMNTPSFRTFLSQAANVGHQFMMLEIVQDELLNKYKEMLYEHKRKIDGGIRDLRVQTGRDLAIYLTDDDIVQMVDEYADHLHQQLKESKVIMVQYPSVSHQKVVQRALQRRRPFDSEGQRGYRDTLIWESILELITKEPAEVAFISQNPRDFAEKTNVLHSVLSEEITALNNNNIAVTYYPDLDSFVSQEITPRLQGLEDIATELVGDGFKGFDLHTFTTNQLYKYIETEEIDPTDIDLPDSFETLQIGAIEDVEEIRDVTVFSLNNNDLLIEYECLVPISFTFFIQNIEYWGISDELLEKIEVWDSDWNDYYQLCHIAVDNILIRVKLVLNQENVSVQSAELVIIAIEE
jgi:hypothetical protein